MNRFEDLIVWQRGMDLVAEVHVITRTGGLARDWGLRNQLTRAAVSIPSNISEGFERGGRKEFSRGVTIAKGSCGELRTQLMIAVRVGYATKEVVEPIVTKAAQLSAMLARLRAALRRQRDGPPDG